MRAFISIIITGLFISTAVNAADFTLTSTSFKNNSIIPPLYSCDGGNVSPQLSWDNAPANTKSFVLVLESPDWTVSNVYLWLLYNIPSTTKSLAQGISKELPKPILAGDNWYDEADYRGPCPPDSLKHHYVFTLYAIDTTLTLPLGVDAGDVLLKINKHIIKQTQLSGTFKH